jgi:hypothetical protein
MDTKHLEAYERIIEALMQRQMNVFERDKVINDILRDMNIPRAEYEKVIMPYVRP